MVLDRSNLSSFKTKYGPTIVSKNKSTLSLPEIELYYIPGQDAYVLWYEDVYDFYNEKFDTYEEGLNYIYNMVMTNEIELCCESYLKLLKEMDNVFTTKN